MAKIMIMDHPLIQHKIGIIRQTTTGTKDFRQLISEIAMLITYEATRDFYEPYEELVPGKIVHDFDELMTALRDKDYEFEKMDGFIKKNFKYTDGKSTDRVIDQLIMGIEPEDNSRR